MNIKSAEHAKSRFNCSKGGKVMDRLKAAGIAFLHPGLVEKCDFTGALKRTNFEVEAKRKWPQVLKNRSLSLVFLDLDNLKEVNDSQGHKAGDQYLKDFAQVVLAGIRSTDIFGRWGGDEFILLLFRVDSTEAERIIRRIHDRFPRFSWGIIDVSSGDTFEKIVERADTTMYQHKKSKKSSRAEV